MTVLDVSSESSAVSRGTKERSEGRETSKMAWESRNREGVDADPSKTPKCIVLYSSCCMDPTQEQDQRRCKDLLKGKGVPFDEVDGSDGASREMRNSLWNVSGHRGKYPQVFMERDREIEFVGLWSDVESLNECEALPADVLKANPEIRTFGHVFGEISKPRRPPVSAGVRAPRADEA